MLRHSRKEQKGVAAVEMAITVPLLLFIMFATMELGRAWMHYNTLTKAVRDGVRYVANVASPGSLGIVNLSGAVVADTQNLVVYGNAGGTGAPLLPSLVPGDITVVASGTEDIVVTATYSYQPMNAFIPGFGVGNNRSSFFTFEAQATMRAL